jgi:PPE-repeat protein
MTSPEIIGAQIYGVNATGPGVATSLLTAQTALQNLATALEDAATNWQSRISELITTAGSAWQGAGATAAQTAAQTYITWLQTTAAEVSQAAVQAGLSAAAYGVVATPAFPGVGVVDPVTVLANRTLRMSLVPMSAIPTVATEIASLDMTYGLYEAQDIGAMATYQTTSAAAGVLPPLLSPDGTINQPVTADPAADPAADPPTSVLSDLFNAYDGFIGTPAVGNSINGAVNTAAWWVCNTIPTAISLGHTLGSVPSIAVSSVSPADGAGITEGLMVGSFSGGGMGMGGAGTLVGAASSASVGEASMIGKLSVPPGWSAAATPATLASSTAPLEGSGWTAAAEAEPVSAMPGMPGAAAAAKGAGAYGTGPRYGTKPIVMPKQVVV